MCSIFLAMLIGLNVFKREARFLRDEELKFNVN
jgi:hypothetical protein